MGGNSYLIISLRDSSERMREALGVRPGLAPWITHRFHYYCWNRPKVNYKYDIINATLCHCAHISCLLGCQQATGWTNGGPVFLVSLAQLVIKPGKNIWVPYKLDHLWIMNFGWQSSGPRAIVLKTGPWTLWWCHFLRLPPVCCGFFLSEAIPGPSRQNWWAPLASTYLYSLRASPYHMLELFIPCLLPVPDWKLPEDLFYLSLISPWTLVWYIIHLLQTAVG